MLPFLNGVIEGLPADLSGLIVTSDLQGVAPAPARGGATMLLGIAVADELHRLSTVGRLPPAEHLGVVLAGDLFSAPAGDVRGATGDVREVWRAFADQFRWVVGVAGNHDLFGKRDGTQHVPRTERARLLDGDAVEFGGLRFSGVSGIKGKAGKPGRKSEADFHDRLLDALAHEPDILVLHQGPNGTEKTQRGDLPVRHDLEHSDCRLVICGHAHWRNPMSELPGGCQVLNVDSRVVILQDNTTPAT